MKSIARINELNQSSLGFHLLPQGFVCVVIFASFTQVRVGTE